MVVGQRSEVGSTCNESTNGIAVGDFVIWLGRKVGKSSDDNLFAVGAKDVFLLNR